MNRWLRCVNPNDGPITGVESSLQPGILRPYFWFSVAKLSRRKAPTGRTVLESDLFGAGWSSDKEESQKKAVTEAVERLAYLQAWDSGKTHGLDLDPTSTGFAAAPPELGDQFAMRGAYHESIERWFLHHWNEGALGLEEWDTAPFPILKRLFKGGEWRLYAHRIYAKKLESEPPRALHAVLSVLHLPDGGLIPGSACGASQEKTVERAAIETFNHVRKLKRLLEGKEQMPPKILVQRLWAHAFDSEISKGANARIRRSLRRETTESDGPAVTLVRPIKLFSAQDYSVCRVLVADAPPMHTGGLERLVV